MVSNQVGELLIRRNISSGSLEEKEIALESHCHEERNIWPVLNREHLDKHQVLRRKLLAKEMKSIQYI